MEQVTPAQCRPHTCDCDCHHTGSHVVDTTTYNALCSDQKKDAQGREEESKVRPGACCGGHRLDQGRVDHGGRETGEDSEAEITQHGRGSNFKGTDRASVSQFAPFGLHERGGQGGEVSGGKHLR